MFHTRKHPVRVRAAATAARLARHGAGIAALFLLALSPARADLTLGPVDSTHASFMLNAVADGGDGTGNGVRFISVDAPSGFTHFAPNDATGTVSDSGPNGTGTGSAAGAADVSFSLAGQTLTIECNAAFITSGTFQALRRAGLGGGDGKVNFPSNFPSKSSAGFINTRIPSDLRTTSPGPSVVFPRPRSPFSTRPATSCY
jgi:hypothetical protein